MFIFVVIKTIFLRVEANVYPHVYKLFPTLVVEGVMSSSTIFASVEQNGYNFCVCVSRSLFLTT